MFKSVKLKQLMAGLLATFMISSFSMPLKVSAANIETVNLQVLATSDTHGKFMPYDYSTNSESNTGSFAQIASIVKELRTSNQNTIVVDNGDTIQDNSASLFLKDEIHPMVVAMNEIGYDTWTMGNHEFNYGIPILEKIVSKSKAEVLGGNIYKPDGSRLFAPYKIVEKGGVKVGIIGMVTPHIVKWDSDNLKGYTVNNPVEETKKVIEEIKDKADVLIAVEHMGPEGEYGSGDSAKELAKTCPELAAIVAGHAHSIVTCDNSTGTVITEPGKQGEMLSKIDIKVTKKDGKYVIEDKAKDVTAKMIYANDKKTGKVYEADKDLIKKLSFYNKRAIDDANEIIGELKGGDLVSKDEIKGIPTSQVQPTAMIDLINKVQMYYGKADVSAAAAFRNDANIKEGKIKKCGSASIYKYDNTLRVYELTGKQLKKYMEWSASYYNTYKPLDLTISFNKDIRGYNYDMFTGVKYEIDISKDAGNRIANLRRMDDTPIKDTDILKVAVNDYRAKSTLLAPKTGLFKEGEINEVYDSFKEMGDDGRIRDLIRKYITEVKKGVITPECDNNWKITGNDWNEEKRVQAVKLINEGKIAIPKSEDGRTPNVAAVTEKDLKKATVKRVDIVTFNDFHGALIEEAKGKNPGAAKLAAVINEVKKSNPNTIVVSGGDIYQGSAMSNLLHGQPANDMVKEVGVVASAVGNHEFDWGVQPIAKWAKEGNFDFLAANMYDKNTNKPISWVKPYKIVEKDGVKIAFIGLATPDTKIQTKAENVKDIDFKDPVESAKEWVNYLKSGKAQEGKPNVIIALTHLASFQDSNTKEITGEAAELCKIDGLDGVISAHSHQSVSGMINSKPLVQAYCNGRAVAKITLFVDELGKVFDSEVKLDEFYKNKDKITVDPTVKAMIDKYEVQLKPVMDEVVGNTDKELPHDRKVGPSLLGEWLCKVMAKVSGVQIALTNGGGLRCPIPQGDITVGKLYELMPFDNTLVTMELKGSDLKKAIENGIANDKIGWVQASGVKVYYDLNLPFGSRITSMRLMDGTLVDMDKYYTIVVNDFMATGGDGFDFKEAKNVINTQLPIRDALINELKLVKNLSLVKSNYLQEGTDPAGTVRVSQSVSKKLPKTGSMIDTNVLVDLGAVICSLGIAMLAMSEDKKKKSNIA